MTAAPALSWDDLPAERLPIRPGDLDLEHTLTCGQAFRWRQSQSGDWQGIFGGASWSIRQQGEEIQFKSWPAQPAASLADYLRLDFDLPAWDGAMAGRDPHLDSARTAFRGLRVLKQDPLEVALTFCISAGNTYPAIVESVDLMCREYGALIAVIDGAPRYEFPTVEALANADERTLAIDCRLDYRAANLIRLARHLQRHPEALAGGLESLDYWQTKAKLIKLPSVGPATADWICLFGLGRDEAVPIDVRTWNLAHRIFPGEITTKTLTPKTYDRVVRLFQARFGETAGWAQEYLYYGSRRGLFRRGRPSAAPTS